jgi:hypothetical protein
MKEYTFEFTDTKLLSKIMGVALLIFLVMIFTIGYTLPYLGTIGAVLFVFAIPVIVVWVNIKKVRKAGTARVHESHAEFFIFDTIERIDYNDIKTYRVDRFKGISLRIKLKDGKKFQLRSNTNFTNPHSLNVLFSDFERVLEKYKLAHNADLVKDKSFL